MGYLTKVDLLRKPNRSYHVVAQAATALEGHFVKILQLATALNNEKACLQGRGTIVKDVEALTNISNLFSVNNIASPDYPGDLPDFVTSSLDYGTYFIKVHKDSGDTKAKPDGAVCAYIPGMRMAVICSKETKHGLRSSQPINFDCFLNDDISCYNKFSKKLGTRLFSTTKNADLNFTILSYASFGNFTSAKAN